MSCNVCYSKFDHSKHKPYFLSNCPHTFCVDCLKRLENKSCPICNKAFKEIHPNLSLLEFIPESEYDIALNKLEKTYKSTISIRSNLQKNKNEKLTVCLREINEIKKQIDKTCEEAINQIKTKRDCLIDQACAYETEIMNLFAQELSPNSELNLKIDLAKSNLNSFESCDLNELCASIDGLNDVRFKLDQLLKDVNNYKSYEFIPSYSGFSFNLGEITNQSKSFEEYKQIGDKFYEIEKFDKALMFYDKALVNISSVKNPSDFFVSIGNVYGKLKEYNEAMSWYEKAAIQDKKNHLAFFLKAQLSLRLNKSADALEALNRALKLDPKNKLYVQVKDNLLATIYPKEPDHEDSFCIFNIQTNFMLKICTVITEYFFQNISLFFLFAFLLSIFVSFPPN